MTFSGVFGGFLPVGRRDLLSPLTLGNCALVKGVVTMLWLVVAQLTVTSSARPLTPAQAVQVLRASHSPQDLTDYRVPPTTALPSAPVVVQRQQPRAVAASAFVPLTCCDVYQLPLPHPVVEVILRKEGR
jgi:hypothetical protein